MQNQAAQTNANLNTLSSRDSRVYAHPCQEALQSHDPWEHLLSLLERAIHTEDTIKSHFQALQPSCGHASQRDIRTECVSSYSSIALCCTDISYAAFDKQSLSCNSPSFGNCKSLVSKKTFGRVNAVKIMSQLRYQETELTHRYLSQICIQRTAVGLNEALFFTTPTFNQCSLLLRVCREAYTFLMSNFEQDRPLFSDDLFMEACVLVSLFR